MAKKDKRKDRGRDWKPWYIGMRVDIPLPKGKFRNLFEEKGMIPESMKRKKPDEPKAE